MHIARRISASTVSASAKPGAETTPPRSCSAIASSHRRALRPVAEDHAPQSFDPPRGERDRGHREW